MNEELIQHQIGVHEVRINNHGDRIDKLECKQAEMAAKIDNLCNSLDSLTSAIKWLICLIVTTLVGFFMWVIQSNLF